MTTRQELEQSIKQGELLLAQEKFKVWSSWLPFIFILPFMCRMTVKVTESPAYMIFVGLMFLYMGFSIWRSFRANQNVKKLKAKIEQYRDQKAKLIDQPL